MLVILLVKWEWINVCLLVFFSELQLLYWFLKDWESFSLDVCLFVWEMVVFRFYIFGRQFKLLDWDWVIVLIIFNMLVLLGMVFLLVEEFWRDELNMRQYNYSMMKKIVFNGINFDMDWKFLWMMEYVFVYWDKFMDWFIDFFDSYNVRFRFIK